MTKYYNILLLFVLMMFVACQHNSVELPTDEILYEEDRPLVELSMIASLDETTTRVAVDKTTTKDKVDESIRRQALKLTWEAEEKLGVYIKKTDGTHVRAGVLTSKGEAGGKSDREFRGVVSEKENDEEYVFLHPNMGTRTSINYALQYGELDAVGHLKPLIPLVWTQKSPGVYRMVIHGYVVRFELTFDCDPGTIRSITLQTDGVAAFGGSFETSTMLPTESSSLVLNVTGGEVVYEDGTWTVVAYMASSKTGLNVYDCQFNVEVSASNGTFVSDYRHFPGYESATGSKQDMIANADCYNMARNMTLVPPVTPSAP